MDLTVRENEEVNPETLVLDAEVAGEAAKGSETRTSPGILSVAIEDTTPRLVRAKSEEDIHAALMAAKDAVMGDHGLNPGEDFELRGSDLFDAAADVTVSYEVESDSESTASVSVVDGTIAVMPTSEGTAHVTVTATATPTASSVEIIEQTEADVARILFTVEVTLEPPTFSMSADDTDIVEGMSGKLTVSASRPVSTDTDVMIVRDGTSSAGADDYRLDPMTVTIEASAMSGHTLVEAVEDGTAEEGEVLTLFAVVDGVQMPDVSVSFRLWTPRSRRCRSSRRSCWPRSSLSADTGATCSGGSAADRPATTSRITTPSPPAATRRPAAPRPGRPRACGSGPRDSRPSRPSGGGARTGRTARRRPRPGSAPRGRASSLPPPRMVCLLGRLVAKARPEAVRYHGDLQIPGQARQGHVSSNDFSRVVGNASGPPASTAPPVGTAASGRSRWLNSACRRDMGWRGLSATAAPKWASAASIAARGWCSTPTGTC